MVKKMILLVCCLTGFAVFAQETETNCQESIYMVLDNDDDYLYADRSGSSEDQAEVEAKASIRQKTSNYLFYNNYDNSERQIDNIHAKLLKKCVTTRGKTFRVFFYIKKSDINSMSESKSIQNDVTNNESNVTNDTELDTNTYQEDELDTAEAFIIEVDDMEDWEKDELAFGDTLAHGQADTKHTTPAVSDTTNAVLQFLLTTGIVRKSDFFNHFKECQCGTYRQNIDITATDYFLVLYDRDGYIKAILYPYDPTSGTRKNLVTDQPDSVNNYKGCAIDGFYFY